MRKAIGFFSGAVFAVVLLTCAGDPQTFGPMLGGGPEAGVGDGSGATPANGDAIGTPGLFDTANAQPGGAVLTASCDRRGITRSTSSTTTVTMVSYYAEFAVAGLRPEDAPRVSAVQCDQETLGTPPTYPGTTVVTDGYALPVGHCWTAVAVLAPGKVIVSCGNRSTTTTDGKTTYDYGQRWRTVYVRVN